MGNGLVESSNKNLMTIIKKIIGDNKKSWDNKIKFAFWVDRITKKSATGKFHFELVYDMNMTLLVHLKLLVYQALQDTGSDQAIYHSKIHDLVELDEVRRRAVDHNIRS